MRAPVNMKITPTSKTDPLSSTVSTNKAETTAVMILVLPPSRRMAASSATSARTSTGTGIQSLEANTPIPKAAPRSNPRLDGMYLPVVCQARRKRMQPDKTVTTKSAASA